MRAAEREPFVAGERGAALLVAIAVTALVASLAALLVLSITFETLAAFNFRGGIETLLAADAGIERALPDLAASPDWTAVLNGSAESSFIDGVPGTRTLAGGRVLDLGAVVNLANCGHAAPCTEAEMNATTALRPWGPNNPRWRLYMHGPLANLAPGLPVESPCYVVVLVADDPEENDNDPMRDAVAGQSAGAGVLLLRSEAFGPGGAHSVVEASVAKTTGPAGAFPVVRLLGWHELREPGS